GGIASVWIDITENKRQEGALAHSQAALVTANRRLTEMAERDPLTGLFNRRKFLGDADDLLAQGRAFALILLDLDHFKDV
ncbi:GGDEF domain-containing protein, partial [Acinetobacter baumannii]